MLYNEKILIENNKAKRILELCKTRGIELYDQFSSQWSKSARTNKDRINKQEKIYLAQYSEWTSFTLSKFNEIFLTPRLSEEFTQKEKNVGDYLSNKSKINIHLEHILVHQVYLLETIINDVDNFEYNETMPTVKSPYKKVIHRLFNIDSILNIDLTDVN